MWRLWTCSKTNIIYIPLHVPLLWGEFVSGFKNSLRICLLVWCYASQLLSCSTSVSIWMEQTFLRCYLLQFFFFLQGCKKILIHVNIAILCLAILYRYLFLYSRSWQWPCVRLKPWHAYGIAIYRTITLVLWCISYCQILGDIQATSLKSPTFFTVEILGLLDGGRCTVMKYGLSGQWKKTRGSSSRNTFCIVTFYCPLKQICLRL